MQSQSIRHVMWMISLYDVYSNTWIMAMEVRGLVAELVDTANQGFLLLQNEIKLNKTMSETNVWNAMV